MSATPSASACSYLYCAWTPDLEWSDISTYSASSDHLYPCLEVAVYETHSYFTFSNSPTNSGVFEGISLCRKCIGKLTCALLSAYCTMQWVQQQMLAYEHTKNQGEPHMRMLKSDCWSRNSDNLLLHFFSGECLLQMTELSQYAVCINTWNNSVSSSILM